MVSVPDWPNVLFVLLACLTSSVLATFADRARRQSPLRVSLARVFSLATPEVHGRVLRQGDFSFLQCLMPISRLQDYHIRNDTLQMAAFANCLCGRFLMQLDGRSKSAVNLQPV